nr:unnamed protein product [Callosobruchus analis]
MYTSRQERKLARVPTLEYKLPLVLGIGFECVEDGSPDEQVGEGADDQGERANILLLHASSRGAAPLDRAAATKASCCRFTPHQLLLAVPRRAIVDTSNGRFCDASLRWNIAPISCST